MFDLIISRYQIDWRIFMASTAHWLQDGNPYGSLSPEFSSDKHIRYNAAT
jgi:hypothetical protein